MGRVLGERSGWGGFRGEERMERVLGRGAGGRGLGGKEQVGRVLGVGRISGDFFRGLVGSGGMLATKIQVII